MGPEELYKKGTALLQERKFEPAAAAFLAAVKQRKIFPEAYKSLCIAYKELGDLHKAGQCAQLAAESFILQSKLKEAATFYLASRKNNLDLENPFKKLGEASLRQGKTDTGAKLLSLASKCQPEDKDLVCEAALAWKASGHPKQAIRILKKALENGPFATGGKLYEELTGHPWEPAPTVNDPAKELEAILPLPSETDTPGADMPSADAPPSAPENTEEQREKRRAKRYPLFGYYVRMGKEEHEVLNLSATGMAFAVGSRQFAPGERLKLDLFGMEGALCKKLEVVVRHTTDGVAGCSFGKLSKKQRAAVQALIEPHQKDDFVVNTDGPIDLSAW